MIKAPQSWLSFDKEEEARIAYSVHVRGMHFCRDSSGAMHVLGMKCIESSPEDLIDQVVQS
jgi:hypothetical protein